MMRNVLMPTQATTAASTAWRSCSAQSPSAPSAAQLSRQVGGLYCCKKLLCPSLLNDVPLESGLSLADYPSSIPGCSCRVQHCDWRSRPSAHATKVCKHAM